METIFLDKGNYEFEFKATTDWALVIIRNKSTNEVLTCSLDELGLAIENVKLKRIRTKEKWEFI